MIGPAAWGGRGGLIDGQVWPPTAATVVDHDCGRGRRLDVAFKHGDSVSKSGNKLRQARALRGVYSAAFGNRSAHRLECSNAYATLSRTTTTRRRRTSPTSFAYHAYPINPINTL